MAKTIEEKEKKRLYRIKTKIMIRSIIYNLKMISYCQDCGSKDNLTFDHILKNGVVKCFNLSDAAHYTYKKVYAEINKCEIVCRICHDIRERKRRWKYNNV